MSYTLAALDSHILITSNGNAVVLDNDSGLTNNRSPTAGSVILAGVLLKMGSYGFMKLGFPLFPDAARAFTPLLMTLSVISIVYGACLALVQTDIKKIIAYSSISHLGYVMLGLVSFDLLAVLKQHTTCR